MRRVGLLVVCLVAILGTLALAAKGPSAPPKPPLPARAWKLAFVRDGDIWIANGDGSGPHRIIRKAESPAWSPDRKQLAFARGGNVWVAKADGSGPRPVSLLGTAVLPKAEGDGPMERPIDISWDRARNMLTFSRQERFWVGQGRKRVPMWGATMYQAPLHPKPPHVVLQALWDYTDHDAEFNFSYHAHPAWAPDGRHLAFARNGDIWIGERSHEEEAEPEWARRWDWELTRVAAVAVYDAPTGRGSRENDGVTHLSWSPDGKVLAYAWQRLGGSGTDEVHLLEIETEKDERIAKDAMDPCFSPDGKWVAVTAKYQEEGVWVIPLKGGKWVLLAKGGEQPAW